MRKKKFNRIKQIPIVDSIAIMWINGMGTTGYCHKFACLKCLTLGYSRGEHCTKCGSKVVILRPYKICDICRTTQSTCNEYCERCGKELEKIHYTTKHEGYFVQKIEKVGE